MTKLVLINLKEKTAVVYHDKVEKASYDISEGFDEKDIEFIRTQEYPNKA